MFNSCENLEELNLGNTEMPYVSSMERTFLCCMKLKSLDLHMITSKECKNMQETFSRCFQLAFLDLSNMQIHSNAILQDMVGGCTNLKYLDISKFKIIRNKTYTQSMFRDCNIDKLITHDKMILKTYYMQCVHKGEWDVKWWKDHAIK